VSKLILHIDFDSFFASVAQQDTPSLRNKPIGVTATNGRNCIIAASREAKRYGIKSPSRTYDARRLCPDIQFVPADFVRYWEISKKFLRICSDYSPYVEVFSIDEVFIDATQTATLFGGVDTLIKKIKKRLHDEIGEYITASVGISHNKLLAKLASGLNKPNGSMRITPETVMEVYRKTKLTDICGIGPRIAARLAQMGISSPYQLQFVPLISLIAEFGTVEGKFLNDVGMGRDTCPVLPFTESSEPKSVSRSYCLAQNEYDQRRVLQNIYELCEELGIKLRRLHKKARVVGLSLRGTESFHTTHTSAYYMDTGKEFFQICLYLLNQSHVSAKTRVLPNIRGYVRQINIWIADLKNEQHLPTPLFLCDQKQQKVTQIIDKINRKYGDHTIRNGFLLYADKLTTVPNGFMADRYERSMLSVRKEL